MTENQPEKTNRQPIRKPQRRDRLPPRRPLAAPSPHLTGTPRPPRPHRSRSRNRHSRRNHPRRRPIDSTQALRQPRHVQPPQGRRHRQPDRAHLQSPDTRDARQPHKSHPKPARNPSRQSLESNQSQVVFEKAVLFCKEQFVLKGRGFSRAIKCNHRTAALAAEGIFAAHHAHLACRTAHPARSIAASNPS